MMQRTRARLRAASMTGVMVRRVVVSVVPMPVAVNVCVVTVVAGIMRAMLLIMAVVRVAL